MMIKIPVNDTVIFSLARLVDDSQSGRRDPSHSDIEFQLNKAELAHVDPHKTSPVGKAKRLRTVFNWALDNDVEKAEKLAAGIISLVISCGGFRELSPNFVGVEAIANLKATLRSVGVLLGDDGTTSLIALDNLSGRNLTDALRGYVSRAKKGIEDAALVVGTSKDLMEAVAAHVIQELWGSYPQTVNFPNLLGQAFTALEMATPEQPIQEGEHQRCRMERAFYETACSINNLRNKQGTGHGRPWPPDLDTAESKAAIEFIGILTEIMLDKLDKKRN